MAEISAHIHSADDIAPENMRAALDGLEILSVYIGTITVVDQVISSLPVSQLEEGAEPTNNMYAHLDPSIDLHLFLAPGQAESSKFKITGLAHKGAGVAWVANDSSPKVLRIATAHEAGHALGYVNPLSKQADRSSYGHCQNSGCIMGAKISVESPDDFPDWSVDFLKDLFGIEELPKDFCEPCQDDIQLTGDINVGMLRTSRRLFGVTPDLIRLSGSIG